MNDIFCPNCRRAVSSGRFCSNCAQPLSIKTESVGFKEFWKRQSVGTRAVISFALFFFLVAAIFALTDKDSSRSYTPAAAAGEKSEKPSTPPKATEPTPPKPTPEIHPVVNFDGRQFIIRNIDSFDWSNVKMELNGGLFSGGYELKHPVIKGRTTYTVGALQFADSDGKRFNPFTMKPQKLTISVDTPDGHAFYVGGWN